MHHAGANVLSPTVRDLSITHRNLPLSRAHPISCPQSRSQRPVYSPPHRERSLDQIVIYLTTEALAALPLRAQPPRPRPRCPQSRSQCILSYRKRSLDQVAICCISPEAVTIRSSTTLKLTPSPQPRCPQNRSQCALSYTPREALYQIAIYFIIRSPSQLFYCAPDLIATPAVQPSIHAPPTRINNNTGTPETRQRIIGDPHAYIRRYQRPRIT